jgi:hypothetical protein
MQTQHDLQEPKNPANFQSNSHRRISISTYSRVCQQEFRPRNQAQNTTQQLPSRITISKDSKLSFMHDFRLNMILNMLTNTNLSYRKHISALKVTSNLLYNNSNPSPTINIPFNSSATRSAANSATVSSCMVCLVHSRIGTELVVASSALYQRLEKRFAVLGQNVEVETDDL